MQLCSHEQTQAKGNAEQVNVRCCCCCCLLDRKWVFQATHLIKRAFRLCVNIRWAWTVFVQPIPNWWWWGTFMSNLFHRWQTWWLWWQKTFWCWLLDGPEHPVSPLWCQWYMSVMQRSIKPCVWHTAQNTLTFKHSGNATRSRWHCLHMLFHGFHGLRLLCRRQNGIQCRI